MLEDRIVYRDGEFIGWNESTVHIMSHSFARGSSIFEVLGFHNTDRGPCVYRLDEHVDRFIRSSKLLEMKLDLTKDEIMAAVLETVKKNGLDHGQIKMMGYYPQVAFEILPPEGSLSLSVFVMSPEEDLGGNNYPLKEGTTASISSWRKLDPQTVPPEAKVAANYINGMMARIEARKRGFDMAIMLDTQGFIAEGGTESIFFVKDGALLTPSLGTILRSITRKSLPKVAESLGIETVEARFRPELIYEAEEAFFAGTSFKILPVRKIEDRVFENVPGEVSKKLLDQMAEITSGRDNRFSDWLFPIK